MLRTNLLGNASCSSDKALWATISLGSALLACWTLFLAFCPLWRGGAVPGQSLLVPNTREAEIHIGSNQEDAAYATFSLHNSGSDVVAIEEISTSCGCTEAKASSTNVTPGASVELRVGVKTLQREKIASHSVYVFSRGLRTGDRDMLQLFVRVSSGGDPASEGTAARIWHDAKRREAVALAATKSMGGL